MQSPTIGVLPRSNWRLGSRIRRSDVGCRQRFVGYRSIAAVVDGVVVVVVAVVIVAVVVVVAAAVDDDDVVAVWIPCD